MQSYLLGFFGDGCVAITFGRSHNDSQCWQMVHLVTLPDQSPFGFYSTDLDRSLFTFGFWIYMVLDWPDSVQSGVVSWGLSMNWVIISWGLKFGPSWHIASNSIKPKLKTALRNPGAAHDGYWRKLQFNGFVFKHFATSVVSTSTLKLHEEAKCSMK